MRVLPAVGFICLGLFIGGVSIDPEVRTVTKTETETRTVTKTRTVRIMPEPCRQALSLAEEMKEAAELIDHASAEQLEIISDGRIALFEQSTNQLNNLETRQRDLSGRTIAGIETLSIITPRYNSAVKACEREMNQ